MMAPPNTQNYKRSKLSTLSLVNLYPEEATTSKSQVALFSRPYLESYAEIGTGPIRGIYQANGSLAGNIFSVSGGSLFNGTTEIGVIPGTERVSIASSINRILVANGTGLYASDGVTVSPVTFPDVAGVQSVAFINGYFIAVRSGSQRFYWSLDGITWDGLDYASAERSTDNIVSVFIVSDQVWFFGETTTEVWVTTGDGEVPFQRIDGRLFNKGCRNRDTVSLFDNSVVWVGNDGIVYRGDTNPLRVSDHSVEETIATTPYGDLRAWAFVWLGHLQYALATSDGTQVYDASSGQWFKYTSYDRPAWRAHLGVFNDGLVIAGDDEEGRLWKFVDNSDELVESVWTVLLMQQGFCDNIAVEMATGQTEILNYEPQVEYRVSRDGTQTWSDYRQASMGKTGQYRKRAVFRRLGVVDAGGMAIEFRITDPALRSITGHTINEGQSGRGRG
jgi:hypothetical protein